MAIDDGITDVGVLAVTAVLLAKLTLRANSSSSAAAAFDAARCCGSEYIIIIIIVSKYST